MVIHPSVTQGGLVSWPRDDIFGFSRVFQLTALPLKLLLLPLFLFSLSGKRNSILRRRPSEKAAVTGVRVGNNDAGGGTKGGGTRDSAAVDSLDSVLVQKIKHGSKPVSETEPAHIPKAMGNGNSARPITHSLVEGSEVQTLLQTAAPSSLPTAQPDQQQNQEQHQAMSSPPSSGPILDPQPGSLTERITPSPLSCFLSGIDDAVRFFPQTPALPQDARNTGSFQQGAAEPLLPHGSEHSLGSSALGGLTQEAREMSTSQPLLSYRDWMESQTDPQIYRKSSGESLPPAAFPSHSWLSAQESTENVPSTSGEPSVPQWQSQGPL